MLLTALPGKRAASSNFRLFFQSCKDRWRSARKLNPPDRPGQHRGVGQHTYSFREVYHQKTLPANTSPLTPPGTCTPTPPVHLHTRTPPRCAQFQGPEDEEESDEEHVEVLEDRGWMRGGASGAAGGNEEGQSLGPLDRARLQQA